LTSHHERQRSSISHGSARRSEDDEEADLRRELEMELEEEGGHADDEGERGLEETLERIGMGQSRIQALTGMLKLISVQANITGSYSSVLYSSDALRNWVTDME
jgi:hypothetical protein